MSEGLRAELCRLTGYVPGRTTRARAAAPPRVEEGMVVEELVLEGPTPFPATLTRPEMGGRHPAVLYCHAHGGDYVLGRRELLDGSVYFEGPGYGAALAAMGFAALCIDMPGFGDRRREGSEAALSKALSWKGKSLFGLMLADLGLALGYLTGREDVRPDRIYSYGLSMGAAQALWLAALDDRIAGCAHACILADVARLIETGDHDRHGVCLTVPGLLDVADMGEVAGLIAPRPQIVCHGEADPLTPPHARDAALAALRAAYDRRRDATGRNTLHTMTDPAAGHVESAAMRVAVLDFLSRAASRGAFFAA
ncbi:alpha/beta fold hydrolase [Silicimonas algicola]|uniref:Dienelactone hydrolase n=1 Tax=Silicimonas algicola TaxID=1826607 RepID=A0A316G1C1_9RHOB|nr:alpha/beta fold hydrolase [Silicimonas algicola]AZQ68222.1 alpha/beta fold hydrolase [Silicimonas algicola]PWK54649.1 dienelactone hydrolase [Silicimonas algicola]